MVHSKSKHQVILSFDQGFFPVKVARQENEEPEDSSAEAGDLRSIGISAGDVESDIDTAENLPDENATKEPGQAPEVVGPVGGPESGPAPTNPPIGGGPGM